MSTHGIKISLPGYEVQTCTAKQCSLHSDYSSFKSRLIGSISVTANIWVSINHDFGYIPNYSAWYSGSEFGLSGIFPASYSFVFFGSYETPSRIRSYATSSKIYFFSEKNCTVYYYIYAELAGPEPTSTPVSPDYGDFGLIICKEGKNILTAKPYEINFLSTWPNFKVKSEIVWPGTTISKNILSTAISSTDTSITFPNANKYGDSGEIVVCGTAIGHQWSWGNAISFSDMTDYVNQYGFSSFEVIEDYYGSQITYPTSWTGDGSSRVFTYSKDNWTTTERIETATGWEITAELTYETWTKWDNGKLLVLNIKSNSIPILWCLTNLPSGFTYEWIKFSGSTSSGFIGCSRGQNGTYPVSWPANTNIKIKPVTTIFKIADNDLNYNPAFMAWTIGPFDATDVKSIPNSNGYTMENIVLTNSGFFYFRRNPWYGSSDDWITSNLPYVDNGVYLKIMYDELGT